MKHCNKIPHLQFVCWEIERTQFLLQKRLKDQSICLLFEQMFNEITCWWNFKNYYLSLGKEAIFGRVQQFLVFTHSIRDVLMYCTNWLATAAAHTLFLLVNIVCDTELRISGFPRLFHLQVSTIIILHV